VHPVRNIEIVIEASFDEIFEKIFQSFGWDSVE